jgi:flagellar L-ring protein precursor FlgH
MQGTEEGQAMEGSILGPAVRRHARGAMALAAALGLANGASGQASTSLWSRPGATPRSCIADQTAHGIGDIVTVVVQEGQLVQDDGKLETNKSSSLDSALQVFDLKPNAFNTLPALKYTSERTVDGESKYSQKGKFETKLSAVVLDVKPNGAMLIEGRRTIHLDGDVKEIRVRGLVRPIDLRADNSVSSDRIADADILYDSDGGRSRNIEKNWFENLLDFIWPF